MLNRKLFACASAFALALEVGCSKDPEAPESPVSPSPVRSGVSGAGPNGETLKATAPTPQAPVNNAQPDNLALTAGKASGTHDQGLVGSYSYEFKILNAANATVCAATIPGGAGSSVTWTPVNCNLEFDAPHTWQVRATVSDGEGPWSPAASFRSPIGGYIRGSELY